MKIKIETVESDQPNKPGTIKVYDSETNNELKNIAGMTIQILPNRQPIAYVDMYITPEAIECEALLSFASFVEAAEFYGFDLVRREVAH